ncbi:hypothetical protein PMAYCL1PPCAC_24713, partial [Pristionchus mayeri]
KKKRKKKKIKEEALAVVDPPGDLPSTFSLTPYPHDPPVEAPVHIDGLDLDGPVPGLLPRRKKTVAAAAAAVIAPSAFKSHKPWSAPTLPPPDPPKEVAEVYLEPEPAPLAVPVVQPRRTDGVRVGKPLNPPVNPARFLSLEQGEHRSKSMPRSSSSSELLMKAPPKRTQSDIGDASGISSASSSSATSTRVVGTKKKKGKAPPKQFKIYACPDNILRPQTNYSGQPETISVPTRKAKSQ